MPSTPRLMQEANVFASDMSSLLNHTVTSGPRLNAVSPRDGVAFVGYRVTRSDSRGTRIPLTINKRKTNLYLYVSHAVVLDTDQVHLTSTRSNYLLQIGEGEGVKDLIAMDYTREPKNKYPGAHIHIGCDSQEFSELFEKQGLPKRKIRDLHIPVGGRRYRPCLEDLIEFCILEGFVEPQNEDWQEHLNNSREAYYQMQCEAVVRRSPEVAARVLRENGWGYEPLATRTPPQKAR